MELLQYLSLQLAASGVVGILEVLEVLAILFRPNTEVKGDLQISPCENFIS